jgi:ABC-type tungstate transport system permease subunit
MGQGMGQTLNVAAEKRGCTLTERGTFRVAPGTQEVIRTFGVGRLGMPLFFPDAGRPDAN